MYFKALASVALAAVTVVFTNGPVAAADWQLKGSWRLNVTCRDYTQINNLTIGQATASKVIGTTNVNDGFGKIVGGSFDGENFVFTNKYNYNGRTYTETWRGKLSNGGRSIRGTFDTNNAAAGGCTYRGKAIS